MPSVLKLFIQYTAYITYNGIYAFRKEEIVTNQEYVDQVGLFYPSSDTAFKALLSARFCAAVWSHITDCDEAYNYWEPVSSANIL